uniref:Ig-like domain-containing protein n=1 Tax=Zonotrichia albicollis TaxID=44394 RepID=A0A8D2LZI3_ZONAL
MPKKLKEPKNYCKDNNNLLNNLTWTLLLEQNPTLALAGWCPLSPTGAQTTQLLVEPPWMLAVLWDWVTLTCQGSGTAGSTTWYMDGQRWWREGQNCLAVTKRGTYICDRPGTGLSPPVTVSNGPSMWDIRAPTSAWPPTSWDRTAPRVPGTQS